MAIRRQALTYEQNTHRHTEQLSIGNGTQTLRHEEAVDGTDKGIYTPCSAFSGPVLEGRAIRMLALVHKSKQKHKNIVPGIISSLENCGGG